MDSNSPLDRSLMYFMESCVHLLRKTRGSGYRLAIPLAVHKVRAGQSIGPSASKRKSPLQLSTSIMKL
jgi:hypothetical protein